MFYTQATINKYEILFFLNSECKKTTVTTTIWLICVAFALFAIIVIAALVIVWINKRKER